jgi:hypothetical protein
MKMVEIPEEELYKIWINLIEINNNLQTTTHLIYGMNAIERMTTSNFCCEKVMALTALEKAKKYDGKKFDNLGICFEIIEKQFKLTEYREKVLGYNI